MNLYVTKIDDVVRDRSRIFGFDFVLFWRKKGSRDLFK